MYIDIFPTFSLVCTIPTPALAFLASSREHNYVAIYTILILISASYNGNLLHKLIISATVFLVKLWFYCTGIRTNKLEFYLGVSLNH